MRTGSWAVEWRCRRMRATKRGGCTCIASIAAMTATATKRTRRKTVSPTSRFVSRTATATMGPNSPTAPTDRMVGPIAVRSTPASRRIGSNVVSAVVVRQSATTIESRTRPVACSATPTPRARITEAPQEPAASPRCPLRMTARSSSVPARNIRKVRPKSDSAVTIVSGCASAST